MYVSVKIYISEGKMNTQPKKRISKKLKIAQIGFQMGSQKRVHFGDSAKEKKKEPPPTPPTPPADSFFFGFVLTPI